MTSVFKLIFQLKKKVCFPFVNLSSLLCHGQCLPTGKHVWMTPFPFAVGQGTVCSFPPQTSILASRSAPFSLGGRTWDAGPPRSPSWCQVWLWGQWRGGRRTVWEHSSTLLSPCERQEVWNRGVRGWAPLVGSEGENARCLSQFLEVPTALGLPWCGDCVPSNFCLRHPWRSSGVPVVSTPILVRRTQGFQFRAYLILYDLILTWSHLRWPFFQTRSHSQGSENRTSTYSFLRHPSTHNKRMRPEGPFGRKISWRLRGIRGAWEERKQTSPLTEVHVCSAVPQGQAGSVTGECVRSYKGLRELGFGRGAGNTVISKSKACLCSSAREAVGSNLMRDKVLTWEMQLKGPVPQVLLFLYFGFIKNKHYFQVSIKKHSRIFVIYLDQ